jgi:cyclopropane fatty-acyl-phospholipid synthase-like methyltransferase
MKIIAIAKPGQRRTPEQIQLHVKQEARQAWEKYLKGIAREFYYSADQLWQVPLCETGELA